MAFRSCGVSARLCHGRSRLGRVCFLLGLAGAVVGALPHGRAEAAYTSCRSDPVIVVNGTEADVVSTLWTDPSAVRELDYTVTVPTGSLINKTTLTVGLGFPEKVTYVFSANQRWGTMRIAATVQAYPGVAPFPTNVQVTTLTTLLNPGTASGFSNSTLTVLVGNQIML